MLSLEKLKNILFLITTLIVFSVLSPNIVRADTILFSDNFDDGNALGWSVPRNSCSSAWGVNANRYGIIIASPCLTETIPSSLSIPAGLSYAFEVDMTMSPSTNMDRNFVFKYKDSNNWYDLHILGQNIHIQKVVGGVEHSGGLLPNPFSTYPFQNGQTYHFKIEVYENLVNLYVDGTLNNSVSDPVPHFPNSSAGLQASSGGVPNSEVWFDNVVVTEISSSPSATPTQSPSPTPTLTPVPTPSPSPSPIPTPTPTLIPVTKVVFLPGGGASWNPDAILNCKTSGYNGDWTLAPYAEGVYKSMLTALSSSNWNAKPFYYDWRNDVRNTSPLLSNFINTNSGAGEKVALVGHSMGGLISRAYLESQNGQKVDSFISAGSPYKGSALAYPAWSGGEIMEDNFITKVATTLFLKRCGGLNLSDREVVQTKIPSVQNILPTTNYLRDSRTNQLKPVGNMNAKNNWLPTPFDPPFWGVRVGTLSGTGFPTLKVIKVNDPSRRDVQLGNWLDGKPTGKEKTNLGDGIVLVESSQIPGASVNTVINQNHSGLMASSEGMSKVLSFLGTPPAHGFRLVSPALAADIQTNNSVYAEPNSMLVIIGYPGNFWITDKNGNVTQDTNGMITFTNPSSGNFELNLVPQSNNTLFIVAQFLPNGETLYKEYKFTNLQPKTKIIEFDTRRQSEDILKDKKDYHKPHFLTNWWHFFWRFPF